MYKTRTPMLDAAFAQSQRPFTRKVIDLTTAITDQLVQLPGDFLYIDQASTGYVTIELNTAQGGAQDPITLAAGGSIECNFANFKLTAPAQLNKSVTLIVGNGARIKGGANINASSMSVSVVDGGKLRTVNNQAFIGYGYQAAVAASYSHVQIWNPSNSGKNVFVEKLWVGVSVAGSVTIARHNSALATAGGNWLSKYSGGADAVSQIKTGANASALYSGIFAVVLLPASATFAFEFTEPLLLTPGKGLVCINQTASRDIAVSPELFEE